MECGDVAPGQNPIGCQSERSCEEFKAITTREGRSDPLSERQDTEK